MNGFLSSVWLVAVLANLWDVTLFPSQTLACQNRRSLASSGLLLVNQACVIQYGGQDFPARVQAPSARGGVRSTPDLWSLPGKPGAKSRFVNQVFLFRIYCHYLKICFRTCKSILGFVNPFKDIEINFWTYKTLKTIWLQLPLERREIYKSKAGC